MTREIAQEIVRQLINAKGPVLTHLEAMMMTQIPSDDLEVYAVQKGDVTFLVRVSKSGYVSVKTIAW